MRIELTFPDQSQETADLKSGTGTSSVTSPFGGWKKAEYKMRLRRDQ
jgi:hypothetical protein